MTTLNFDVFWRDRGATQGLKKLSDQSARAERGMQRFQTVGKLAGLAVGAAIGKFAVDSVKAYSEAETAQAKLQNAFQKFPKLADTNINALRGLNTELARKTKFDDDATASGQAVLAQFNLTGQQIQRLTPLLQDYAAKTGKDLPTAARDLGKATLGQGRALKAVGINFKDTGSAAGNFEQIMGGLRSQVGGFAEAEGKTAAGQLAILKNQFGELQEEAGSHLVPALTKVVSGTTRAVQAFGELGPGAKAAISTLVVGGPGIAIAAVAIGKVGTVAKETAAALKLMGISAKGATIATAGIGAALGIAALAFGMYAEHSAKSKQVTEDFTEALKSETSEINKNVTAVAAKALQDRGAFDAARELGLGLDVVTQAALGNASAQARVNAVTDEAIRLGLNSADVDANIRVDAANQLSDAIRGTGSSYQKAVGNAKNMSEATGQAGGEMSDSARKTAEAKRQLDEWRASAIKAARAAIGLSGSQIDYEQAVDDATKSVKQNGRTLDTNTEKGRNNKRALNNLATASLLYREKLIEQGASTKKVNRAEDDARAAFIKTAMRMGKSRDAAEKLADKYGLVDRKINSLNNKTVKTKVTFSVSGSGFKLHIPNSLSVVKEMATGGPVRGPGGPTTDSVLGVDAHGIPTARVSAGEFVVNAKAYQRNKSLVEAINRDGLAVGGVVDPRIYSNRFPNPSYTGNALQSRAARAISKRIGNAVGKAIESTGMGIGFTGPAGPRTTFRGGTFTTLFARNLALVERAAHQTFRVFQGGWRPRTSYSGTSHAGDAIDFQVNYTLGRLFRKYIGASGDRTGKGNWSPHIHAVPSPSHGRARGSAVWQYQDYVRRGGARQSMRSPWGLARGGTMMNPSMIGVAEAGPEKVLTAAQTRSFDRMVKVMDQAGGGVVNNYYLSAPNYVGSKQELVTALVELKRQNRLEVITR